MVCEHTTARPLIPPPRYTLLPIVGGIAALYSESDESRRRPTVRGYAFKPDIQCAVRDLTLRNVQRTPVLLVGGAVEGLQLGGSA